MYENGYWNFHEIFIEFKMGIQDLEQIFLKI